ncbi:protein dopey-2 isoform X1 [Poecilia latipinna]|uniref:protein dopey-2 isoform X1 n=1 Tax=Poecilia latipinna TaxID=48699 RepID=UPI00072DBD41|nr:PREDICTED: protein dopey-2 isoform X1 [Poecilia latipinna]
MDPEELELQNDYRYRNYAAVIEKALRNFESSSEWADLISSLGKLNKALQSNLRYSLLPKRLIIGKRLAQCLHPALPSGVHLKALETYEVIFKIIGTKWLAKDLFIYSSGLFPLLGHAAMAVKPVLLTLYERYYLPLQRALLPSLQAFVTGLLPGLEEGLEVYDRTDALLVKLSLLVGQQVFFGALWGSMLVTPMVRLPASVFVVTHFDRMAPLSQQTYMLGYGHHAVIKSVCLSLQDSNVLVQRNMLEVLLYFFPFATCLDPAEPSVALSADDMITVASAALLTLLRRDMSLNRRLYAWLLGTDIKGGMVAPHPTLSTTVEEHTSFYFNSYSKDYLVKALINILKQKEVDSDPESVISYLRPFRIIISLLDKPEIGPAVLSYVLLEVVRAFQRYCLEMLGEENIPKSGSAANQLACKVKENKNASEIIKTVNMLVSSLNSEYLWEYMTQRFCTCLSEKDDPPTAPEQDYGQPAPSVTEMSNLIIFLLDVLPLELYADIQSLFLPNMLGTMLQSLHRHMDSISLDDITQGLRVCFKILSKIQMPVAYMDVDAGANTEERESASPEEETANDGQNEGEKNGSVNGHQEDERETRDQGGEAEPANGVYSTLRSEDSGLGVSASPSEQHLQLGMATEAERNGTCKTGDGVWRRGGSVEAMTRSLQDILAFITTRYLMVQVEDVADPDPEPQRDQSTNSGDQKSLSRGREIKHKLSELFTPNKRKASVSPDTPLPPSPTEKKKERGSSVCLDWAAGYMPRGKAEISEACRQTFVATCHLLLESTTFPVYLSEEEMLALYTDMFGHSGRDVDGLPVWLRSLMILCCMSRDYNIQHTAVASLLELINHSQSLALVIEDKHRRYQSSDNNPLSGRLQMVSVPPIYPVLHRAIEEHTDFFQRLSRVLWSQLDTEQREQHVSCVDLFYRLHCLAPSASICEDIICQALLHKDKAIRLEALHRFTVLWHLTRETQCSRTMSLSRSFDRSLCVVVDSLTSADGSISAAAQCWLVRALSLNDVIRILEPILLLLLHPSTQRCSIQSVKQNLTAGNLKLLNGRRSLIKTSRTPADMVASDVTTLSSLDVVDREALWAELESGPEPQKPEEALPASRSESEGTEEDEVKEEEEEDAESEHTESADTSGAPVSTENSSSGSAPPSSVEEGGLLNGLRRVESEHTQASDSLSSEEEEDFELEAMARSRLLKQEREKREAIDSLFRHVLLYPAAAGGWRRLLQGLALLDSLLRSSPECHLVDALCCTSLDTSSAAHLNLVSNLLQRHQQAQDGRCFYGCLLSPTSSPSAPPSLLVELLVSLCLQILRSHYPSYLSLTPLDLQGNMEVQVKSVTVLTRIVKQLCFTVRGQECSKATLESIHRLLTCCKVQQYALLSLSASMYVSQKAADKGASKGAELLDEAGGLSEESLVNLGVGGGSQEQCPLQIELLKLLQALIVLEYHVWPGGVASAVSGTSGQPGDPRESSPASTPLAREWQTAVLFQQSIKAAQYVQSHPITAQGMFVSAAARALQPQYGYAMHPHWVSLLCSSLPYLGRSLGIIVSPLISQICKNMDDLVKLHEHEGGKANHSLTGRKENIAPDYPLTLLEGLTTITHYCLLDNKKSLVACDPVDVRNARNAVLEALPQMLSSMALLWGVVVRDEFQRRASDSGHSSKHASTSVYFKSSKILRQRILQFLLPLTGHYGVQLMASVGVVWSSRKSKRRHKNQVLPVASEARLVVVELIKSLHTLNIETVLHLVKEVVKRPHQIKGEQKATLVDIPMLQFSYAYVQSISAAALQENVAPLLSLLRESVQLNLAPPGHFLLLGILNDFVNRLPNLDSKKDSKDLQQEVTQRILETVGGIAGSSLEQTSWLSRSLEVKVQPQVCVEAEEPDDAEVDGDHCESLTQANAMVSSSAPSVYSVQALTLLAEILAPLLDMVYRSDEKEKAVPLISRLLYYVFPYLKNHSAYNMPSFAAGAQLLSSLSGYACTKRAWKKEVFELFMDPLFFTMDASCAHSWKSIIDHLLTHEKTMFKDLMGMQSSSLKLFPSADQKPMLLKRQAFAMFSGELDQYHLYLPLIQERLTETLKMNSSPAVSAQMFLMFRVLLLRISSQHLTSLWPIMVTELIRIFARLEKSLQPEKDVSKLTKVVRGALDKNGPVNFSNAELDMYLSACKFLDTSLAFPPEKMPLFQMYRWAFVPEVDVSRYSGPENTLIEGEQECTQHVVRVLEGIQQRYGALNGLTEESSTDNLEFPLLTQSSLSSITQLLPFLRTLCCSFQAPPPSGQPAAHFAVAEYPAASSHIVLSRLEGIIENEFLDSMES